MLVVIAGKLLFCYWCSFLLLANDRITNTVGLVQCNSYLLDPKRANGHQTHCV